MDLIFPCRKCRAHTLCLCQVGRGKGGCCQCSQNVDVNGPHRRCFELIVSSLFNQPMAVERGRSHVLVGSMVGAVYVHILRTLAVGRAVGAQLTPDTMVSLMLQSEQIWMKTRELDGRAERGNNGGQ